MNSNTTHNSGTPGLITPEPVLREKIENVCGILDSILSITNRIEGKLFMPILAVAGENTAGGNTAGYNGNELEYFIDLLDRKANKIEFTLSSIDNRL